MLVFVRAMEMVNRAKSTSREQRTNEHSQEGEGSNERNGYEKNGMKVNRKRGGGI